MADKVVFEQYDNIYKFMDIIETRKNNGIFSEEHSKREGKRDWRGTDTYKEALELFASGIPDEADKLKRSLNTIKNNSSASSPKRIPQNYYYGYAPNIPAAIIGLPKSMKRVHNTPQKVKTVSIFYDGTMNAGTDGETLEQAGETILQLVYLLEVQGYRVALSQFCFAANYDEENAICSILLKDWKQHFDLLKLSFPLTSPAMFRRFGFRWIETLPNISNRGWDYGYGHHLHKSDLLPILEKQHLNLQTSFVIGVPECKDASFDAVELGKSIGLIK